MYARPQPQSMQKFVVDFMRSATSSYKTFSYSGILRFSMGLLGFLLFIYLLIYLCLSRDKDLTDEGNAEVGELLHIES